MGPSARGHLVGRHQIAGTARPSCRDGVNHTQPLPYRLTALGLADDAGLIGVGDAGLVRLSVAADLQVSIVEVIAASRAAAGYSLQRWQGRRRREDSGLAPWRMPSARRAAALYRLDGQRGSTVRSEIGGTERSVLLCGRNAC